MFGDYILDKYDQPRGCLSRLDCFLAALALTSPIQKMITPQAIVTPLKGPSKIAKAIF